MDRREVSANFASDMFTSSEPSEGSTTGPRGPGRFRLLASAVAGRPVEVASGERGDLPWTDGRTVFIDADRNPARQRAAVVVQASLLGAGSLNEDVLRVLASRKELVRRYLAVEGHRALSTVEQLLPSSLSALVDPTVASCTASSEESLAIARSRDVIDDPPDMFGTIRPERLRASAKSDEGRSATGQHAPRRKQPAGLTEVDDDGADERPDTDLFSSPVGGDAGIGRLFRRLFSERRSSGGGPPGADPATHLSRRSPPGSRTAVLSTAPAPVPEVSIGVEGRAFAYPEWDVHKRRYKADWCTVSENDPTLAEGRPFVPPDAEGLRRPLARLGLQLERHRRQLQGDDLDIDAVVEARVELMAGSVPHEAVYIDTLRTRRDLSVLLLLDISGSASEPGVVGLPVHIHQRAAAGALTVALHEFGDRVALYGFRSSGRTAVHVVPIKRFGDELDALVMSRLGGLVPGAYTRLGAAIRHGTAVLDREAGTTSRLLAVISDGLAYDHGYERLYGEADARRALAEARRRGIGTLCLSIGAEADPSALRRVFGVAAHAANPDLDQLPQVVGPLFASALRSAELQRRVSQRRVRTKERLELDRKTA